MVRWLVLVPLLFQTRPQSTLAIPYTVEKHGYVSLGLYDGEGRLVRSLLHGEPRAPGSYVEPWDGRDRYGHALPAGEYTWRSLWNPGLRTEFVLRLGGNTVPSWDTPVGNHNNMRSFATDGKRLYMTPAEWEGSYCVAATDFDGQYVWTGSPWHQSEKHGMSSTVINGRFFELTAMGTVYGFDAASGQCFTDGNHSPKPWNVRWEGDPDKGDREKYAAVMDLDGDARANHLVVSYRNHDAIRWFDAKNGKPVDQATGISEPVGIAVAPDNAVLAISKGAIVSITREDRTPKTVISGEQLDHPVRIAVDAASGDLLVAENGAFSGRSKVEHHQVKRFSRDGKLIRAYGRPEGRADGVYVATDFRGITDIASDGAGGFFITEFLTAPRRVARFDASGALLREWLGGQPWGWDAVPEPGHPSAMWYCCNPFAMVRCEVDLAKGTWKVLETYTDIVQRHPLYKGDNHIRAFASKGRVYFANASPSPLGILVYDPSAKTLRPSNAGGQAYRGDQKKWSIPEDLRPADGKNPGFYLWSDLNDDGQATANEIVWTARRPGGYIDPNDFTVFSTPEATSYYPGAAYVATGVTARGTPIYALDSKRTSPKWKEDTGLEFHPGDFWRDQDGSLYGSISDVWPGWETHGAWYFNSCSSVDRLVKWDKSGQQVWSVGRHSPDIEHERGSSAMARLLIGTTRGCIFWADGSDEEACQGTVWTDDGLYVGEVPSLKGDATPEWVSRLWCGSEYSFGALFTDAKGDTYLTLTSTAGAFPVFRITGWEGWARGSGTVRLGAKPAEAERAGRGLRAEYFPTPDLSGPPSITRVDPDVYFHWLDGLDPRPIPMAKDFSVRWSGQVEAPTTEEYRFDFSTGTPWRGDGPPKWIRMWVDGRLLVDSTAKLFEPVPYGLAGRIVLRGGERYDLKVEAGFSGKAVAKVCWDTPSRDRRRIQKEFLYPSDPAGTRYPGELLAQWHLDGKVDGATLEGGTWGPGQIHQGLNNGALSATLPVLQSAGTVSLWYRADEQQDALRLGSEVMLRADQADGRWHHAAIAFGGPTSDRRIYLDGLLRSVVTAPPPENAAALRIGLKGSVDEVRVYSRALSAREIRDDVYRREVGLLAYLPCDENQGVVARSTTGTGIEAAFSGPLAWVPGRKGSAIRIDSRPGPAPLFPAELAVDHEVRVPETDYTIAFWFKTSSLDVRLACADRDTPYNNNWVDNVIELRGGKACATLKGSGDKREELVSDRVCNDDRWHHAATTIGGETGEFRLFIDGVEAAKGTMTKRVTYSNRLGLDFGGGRRTEMAVDEIRLYGRALTAPEVKALVEP